MNMVLVAIQLLILCVIISPKQSYSLYTKDNIDGKKRCDYCQYYIETGLSPYEMLWTLTTEIGSELTSPRLRNKLLILEDNLKSAEDSWFEYCERYCLTFRDQSLRGSFKRKLLDVIKSKAFEEQEDRRNDSSGRRRISRRKQRTRRRRKYDDDEGPAQYYDEDSPKYFSRLPYDAYYDEEDLRKSISDDGYGSYYNDDSVGVPVLKDPENIHIPPADYEYLLPETPPIQHTNEAPDWSLNYPDESQGFEKQEDKSNLQPLKAVEEKKSNPQPDEKRFEKETDSFYVDDKNPATYVKQVTINNKDGTKNLELVCKALFNDKKSLNAKEGDGKNVTNEERSPLNETAISEQIHTNIADVLNEAFSPLHVTKPLYTTEKPGITFTVKTNSSPMLNALLNSTSRPEPTPVTVLMNSTSSALIPLTTESTVPKTNGTVLQGTTAKNESDSDKVTPCVNQTCKELEGANGRRVGDKLGMMPPFFWNDGIKNQYEEQRKESNPIQEVGGIDPSKFTFNLLQTIGSDLIKKIPLFNDIYSKPAANPTNGTEQNATSPDGKLNATDDSILKITRDSINDINKTIPDMNVDKMAGSIKNATDEIHKAVPDVISAQNPTGVGDNISKALNKSIQHLDKAIPELNVNKTADKLVSSLKDSINSINKTVSDLGIGKKTDELITALNKSIPLDKSGSQLLNDLTESLKNPEKKTNELHENIAKAVNETMPDIKPEKEVSKLSDSISNALKNTIAELNQTSLDSSLTDNVTKTFKDSVGEIGKAISDLKNNNSSDKSTDNVTGPPQYGSNRQNKNIPDSEVEKKVSELANNIGSSLKDHIIVLNKTIPDLGKHITKLNDNIPGSLKEHVDDLNKNVPDLNVDKHVAKLNENITGSLKESLDDLSKNVPDLNVEKHVEKLNENITGSLKDVIDETKKSISDSDVEKHVAKLSDNITSTLKDSIGDLNKNISDLDVEKQVAKLGDNITGSLKDMTGDLNKNVPDLDVEKHVAKLSENITGTLKETMGNASKDVTDLDVEKHVAKISDNITGSLKDSISDLNKNIPDLDAGKNVAQIKDNITNSLKDGMSEIKKITEDSSGDKLSEANKRPENPPLNMDDAMKDSIANALKNINEGFEKKVIDEKKTSSWKESILNALKIISMELDKEIGNKTRRSDEDISTRFNENELDETSNSESKKKSEEDSAVRNVKSTGPAKNSKLFDVSFSKEDLDTWYTMYDTT